MSEGTQEKAPPVTPSVNGNRAGYSTAEELGDTSRFQFRERKLEVPEVNATLLLRTLSVEEREMLPNPMELAEIDDQGKRTEAAIQAAALTFSVIVVTPDVTAEQAEMFLPKWPAEAFDRVTEAYGELVGESREEEREARAEFPAR